MAYTMNLRCCKTYWLSLLLVFAQLSGTDNQCSQCKMQSKYFCIYSSITRSSWIISLKLITRLYQQLSYITDHANKCITRCSCIAIASKFYLSVELWLHIELQYKYNTYWHNTKLRYINFYQQSEDPLLEARVHSILTEPIVLFYRTVWVNGEVSSIKRERREGWMRDHTTILIPSLG